MTITRDEIQRMRDTCREHAGYPDISSSMGRVLNQTATQLDQLDACLAREGIDTHYYGCLSTSNGEESERVTKK